jgi:hypothetical protein
MQPEPPGKRGTLVSAILSAIVFATLLFVTLRGAAAYAESSPAIAAVTAAPAAGDSGAAGMREQTAAEPTAPPRVQVIGTVLAGPATGFVGEWQILESGEVLTVVVTSATDVKSFNFVPPVQDTWVEARVNAQADGTLVARKFRPNRIQPGEIIARLTSTAVLSDVLRTYERYQLEPLESLLSSARIYRFAIRSELDEVRTANALMADRANFVWAEVNFVSEIPTGNPYRTWKWGSNDPSGYVSQNAFTQIALPPVQGYYSGTNVIVAVLDTGIDATHPSLLGHVLPGIDLVSDDEIPQDGPEANQATGPAAGHGTHISGIVTFIAPESKILPVRVLDVDGRGNTFVLAYAIDWAVAHGATVINMSLGSDYDATVLEEAIANAQRNGAVVVAAAGNDSAENPQFPAAYPGVISVTAVDDNGIKADFANYGAGWVDLAAPGVAITSSVPVSGSILYAAWSGTSMAVPFASGAAALIRSQWPSYTPNDVSSLLIASGASLDELNPTYAGKMGRLLNIDAALPNVTAVEPTPVPPTATPVPTLAPPTPTATPEPTATATPAAPTPLPPTATETPTATPTVTPTIANADGANAPTAVPSTVTPVPSEEPTGLPTEAPTEVPTEAPTTVTPTLTPTPVTETPVESPTPTPTVAPTITTDPSDALPLPAVRVYMPALTK